MWQIKRIATSTLLDLTCEFKPIHSLTLFKSRLKTEQCLLTVKSRLNSQWNWKTWPLRFRCGFFFSVFRVVGKLCSVQAYLCREETLQPSTGCRNSYYWQNVFTLTFSMGILSRCCNWLWIIYILVNYFLLNFVFCFLWSLCINI